jgi:hypothetical protein
MLPRTIRFALALLLWQVCAVQGAPAGNLSLNNEINFGAFTAKLTARGFATASPVNHVEPKSDQKFLVLSLRIVKLSEKAEVDSAKFVLEGARGPFTAPGSWGKIELMGSLRDFEASSGSSVLQHKVGDVVNLFFEVPLDIREADLTLKYR